ncbi:MAG TPA: hypothetical protein VMX57_03375, partial [Planctomycetota bacterium]|nr:hypothetical protein [Planctomycetota bacterium]
RRGVIDPEKGYAYFCSFLWGTEGRIVKVKLGVGDAAPTLTGTLKLPEGKGLIGSAAIDPVHGYAYVGSYCSHTKEGIDTVTPGRIVKVKLGEGDAPPTFVNLLDVPERHFTVILADPPKGLLYLSNDLVYPSSDVVCVAFGPGDATMKRVGALKLRVGPKPWTNPKHVPKGTTNGPDLGELHVQSGVIDLTRGYAYFGTDTWPGQVIKVRLLDHP